MVVPTVLAVKGSCPDIDRHVCNQVSSLVPPCSLHCHFYFTTELLSGHVLGDQLEQFTAILLEICASVSAPFEDIAVETSFMSAESIVKLWLLE